MKPLEQRDSSSSSSGLCRCTRLQRLQRRLYLAYRRAKQPLHEHAVLLFWCAVMLASMLAIIVTEATQSNTRRAMIKTAFGPAILTARISAQLSLFFLLLLTVTRLRKCWTLLRDTLPPFVSAILPVDSLLTIHKWAGMGFALAALIHTLAHLVNFVTAPRLSAPVVNCAFGTCFTMGGVPTYWQWLFTTVPGVTGVGLLLVCVALMPFSAECVRRASFNVFQTTHWFLFMSTYPLVFLHGTWALLAGANAWKYLALPLALFVVERYATTSDAASKTVAIVAVEALPGKAIRVVMKRPPAWTFRSGQYVLVTCPDIAATAAHPFTVSSAPQEPYLVLMIKAVGPWTLRFRERLIAAQDQAVQRALAAATAATGLEMVPGSSKEARASPAADASPATASQSPESEPGSVSSAASGGSSVALSNSGMHASDSSSSSGSSTTGALQLPPSSLHRTNIAGDAIATSLSAPVGTRGATGTAGRQRSNSDLSDVAAHARTHVASTGRDTGSDVHVGLRIVGDRGGSDIPVAAKLPGAASPTDPNVGAAVGIAAASTVSAGSRGVTDAANAASSFEAGSLSAATVPHASLAGTPAAGVRAGSMMGALTPWAAATGPGHRALWSKLRASQLAYLLAYHRRASQVPAPQHGSRGFGASQMGALAGAGSFSMAAGASFAAPSGGGGPRSLGSDVNRPRGSSLGATARPTVEAAADTQAGAAGARRSVVYDAGALYTTSGAAGSRSSHGGALGPIGTTATGSSGVSAATSIPRCRRAVSRSLRVYSRLQQRRIVPGWLVFRQRHRQSAQRPRHHGTTHKQQRGAGSTRKWCRR